MCMFNFEYASRWTHIGGDQNGEWSLPGSNTRHPITCESLRLDLEAGRAGKTWLILPEGFRSADDGKKYPLPNSIREIDRLLKIPIPPGKRDAGCIYLRRALRESSRLLLRKQSAILDIGRHNQEVIEQSDKFREHIREKQAEAERIVDEVRASRDKAIASLSQLFDLGREGLEGQMKAHLSEQPWKGEKISADDFRQCFRMVSQAVKGLGLPSTERETARSAIMEQAAAALRETQEALAMSPSADDDKVQH